MAKESTIASGAQGEAHVSGLNGHHLVFSRGLQRAAASVASVRVSSVEFADGSKWDRALATNPGPDPIDDAATQQSLQPCQESQESAKVLKDLVGGGCKAGSSGQQDGTIFRAYSIMYVARTRRRNMGGKMPNVEHRSFVLL
jgi:hypothetical protein